MREQKYSKELGGTAGCSVRLAGATQYCGSDEENRQKALDLLNDNCKIKGRLLRATKCKAHVDPYEKAQAQVRTYSSYLRQIVDAE